MTGPLDDLTTDDDDADDDIYTPQDAVMEPPRCTTSSDIGGQSPAVP